MSSLLIHAAHPAQDSAARKKALAALEKKSVMTRGRVAAYSTAVGAAAAAAVAFALNEYGGNLGASSYTGDRPVSKQQLMVAGGLAAFWAGAGVTTWANASKTPQAAVQQIKECIKKLLESPVSKVLTDEQALVMYQRDGAKLIGHADELLAELQLAEKLLTQLATYVNTQETIKKVIEYQKVISTNKGFWENYGFVVNINKARTVLEEFYKHPYVVACGLSSDKLVVDTAPVHIHNASRHVLMTYCASPLFADFAGKVAQMATDASTVLTSLESLVAAGGKVERVQQAAQVATELHHVTKFLEIIKDAAVAKSVQHEAEIGGYDHAQVIQQLPYGRDLTSSTVHHVYGRFIGDLKKDGEAYLIAAATITVAKQLSKKFEAYLERLDAACAVAKDHEVKKMLVAQRATAAEDAQLCANLALMEVYIQVDAAFKKLSADYFIAGDGLSTLQRNFLKIPSTQRQEHLTSLNTRLACYEDVNKGIAQLETVKKALHAPLLSDYVDSLIVKGNQLIASLDECKRTHAQLKQLHELEKTVKEFESNPLIAKTGDGGTASHAKTPDSTGVAFRANALYGARAYPLRTACNELQALASSVTTAQNRLQRSLEEMQRRSVVDGGSALIARYNSLIGLIQHELNELLRDPRVRAEDDHRRIAELEQQKVDAQIAAFRLTERETAVDKESSRLSRERRHFENEQATEQARRTEFDQRVKSEESRRVNFEREWQVEQARRSQFSQDMAAQRARIESEAAALEREKGTMKTLKAQHQNELTTLTSEIRRLKTEETTLKGSVATLQSNAQRISQEHESKKAELKRKQEQLDRDESRIRAEKSELARQRAALERQRTESHGSGYAKQQSSAQGTSAVPSAPPAESAMPAPSAPPAGADEDPF